MTQFPRTIVGGKSLSRMIIGTNWFLGYSHQSAAKDSFLKSHQTASRIADILEVFLAAGVDTVMGLLADPILAEAIKQAQDRSGKRVIVIDTPGLPFVNGDLDLSGSARLMDDSQAAGATVFMPHQNTTDALVDRTTRRIRRMDEICKMIRQRGLIPGLSTHMPEAPVYADESGLDVETYIQIYNAVGFLMQVEVDWVHRIIHKSAKPVMTIKPMAAGKLIPLVGLAFAWATLRDEDLVTVGAMTPDEAREDIEISLSILERRTAEVDLQYTRSKAAVEKR